jgi:hypothetical protein
LALLEEFTADKGKLVIQEYTVKAPTPVRSGTAGSITSRSNSTEHYPGGGQQSQLLIDGRDENWKDFLELTAELPIS